MNALDKIKEITASLKRFGIDDASKESEIILTSTLSIDKVVLYRDNSALSEKDMKTIDRILSRRAKREPLQYILGYIEFYGLKIKVGEGVLIPRPETELMAKEVLKKVSGFRSQVSGQDENSLLVARCSPLRILDLCTGSGCLALAIAKNFPDAQVYGTDISGTAIKYAKENAELNEIGNAVFLKGSLYEPLKQFVSDMLLKFDVIVSNPPYIMSNDIANLQPEIKNWEPRNALDGGEDGLKYYRDILSEARRYLTPEGLIFLEIGEGQAEEVSGIAQQNGLGNISVKKDFAGIDRIVIVAA